jgi:hypothetical protein
MKVFLSYRFEDDISVVLKLLDEKNIEIFDSASGLNIGSSLQQALKNAIKECDFLLLIYTDNSTNIAFEAGLGLGLNKPIFSIIAPNSPTPDILLDSPYVTAFPNELEKIKFNFSLFYQKLKPKRTSSLSKTPNYYGGGEPIYFNEFAQTYNTINRGLDSELEQFFKNIFDKYKIAATRELNISTSRYIADFSIWSDPLENILGNPILIEVKNELNPDSLKKLSQNILETINLSPSSSFLVFYDHLRNLTKRDLPNTAKCFYISITDLLDKLKTSGFNDAVKQIRNEIVHNRF